MIETDAARFDSVAQHYEKNVTPIFRGPMADLISLADLQPDEKVLDVGTGTGQAALLAAGKVLPGGSVVGVDESEAMLEIARKKAEKDGLGVEFVLGNAEALDLPGRAFDVVMSAFGLGTTEAANSLKAIRAVLRHADPEAGQPGGRLVLAHWGPTSRPAQALLDLLSKRRSSEATPQLEWLRRTDLTARPWSRELTSPEALAELLRAHGFRDVQASVREYTFSFVSADAYLDMALSFPLARAEFEALSPGTQRMFKHEFNALMAPFRGPNRSILSQDAVLFAVAQA